MRLLALLLPGVFSLITRTGFAADSPSSTPSLKSIEQLANAQTDPDVFIDLLLKKYPQLAESKALVYRSRSPEKDSINAKYPRVLLPAPDGSYFIAFTGDPSKPDYNRIQIIDAKSGAKEIVFSPSRKARPSIHSKPESCRECHGADTNRLIMDSYNFWPGLFGSNESNTPPAKELEKWAEFVATSKGKGR